MHYVISRHLDISVKSYYNLKEAFKKVFETKTPYYQDGCSNIQVLNNNCKPVTKLGIEKICKAMNEGKIKFSPDHYQCLVYDCGVTAWVCKRKKNKIVNHKVKEVIEQRTYHSKPKVGLKGGWIEEVHHILIRYDGRCYDKYEHGGIPGDSDGWNELY